MAEQDQASKDAAMQQRIIKHMNADHQESLSYYLRHYTHLSSREARSPTLETISFEAMNIRTLDGKTHKVAFKPPMKNWGEARTRTVDMDRESREGLDISSIRITEFYPPKSTAHIVVIGGCLLALVSFVTRSQMMEGSWMYKNVLTWFPGGPDMFHWVVKMIAAPVVVLHAFEAFLLDRTRLRKYGVERGSSLWWKWMAMCFLEGYGCFQRIDAAVRRKKEAAEKEKH
ncbi:hypothetical protein G7Y89_g10448 [Cudoniella acicularis]|uniref:DUF2470 domain-containing protein n=1 Tax=Cudoniella acicularis TaxID=354080 RepID=A0A8H4VZ12_9HELO|nr:hypothetical protein G7Y89_g10448 [Cudoniella acicularis]